MDNRIKNLQDYLRQNALDAFLVLTKLNRQYVSGFTGSMGVVFVTRKSAELYVDDRYTIRAKRESDLKVKKIEELKLAGRIGIEDRITVRELASLKKNHKAKWIVATNVVEDLRAVKSAKEIQCIKKAQRIVDACFAQIKKYARVGMTEIEISQQLERTAIQHGADGMAFESIVAFGANAAAPHHLSGKQKIKRNNFLLLDFGVLVKGYHSDFTRTLFIGSPSKKQAQIYNTVLVAQKRGIEKARLGNKASVVDKTARQYIDEVSDWRNKFTQHQLRGAGFTHNTGHGVGLEIHELPNFSPKSDDILLSDMIVTVEPGIYIEGWGGGRIEDMVLIKNKDNEVLSKSPKDIKSMIIS